MQITATSAKKLLEEYNNVCELLEMAKNPKEQIADIPGLKATKKALKKQIETMNENAKPGLGIGRSFSLENADSYLTYYILDIQGDSVLVTWDQNDWEYMDERCKLVESKDPEYAKTGYFSLKRVQKWIQYEDAGNF